ncbi:MAG TPA: hypothetical protein VMW87_11465 [Spirochaetia bacterium]|nr:hypothetical protein [Spirochaetia bacterium]
MMRLTAKVAAAALLAALPLLVAPAALWGQNNGDGNRQQIISVDSPAYQALDSLYLEAGLVEPSAARPYSADEMAKALERIDRGQLSTAGQAAYKVVEGAINHKTIYKEAGGLQLNVSPTITVAGYLATDPHAVRDGATNRNWQERTPLINIPFQIWLFNNFFADVELPIETDPFLQNPGIVTSANESNYTNIPFGLAQLDYMFPVRAFMSTGGSHWNLDFGRDKLDWGNSGFGNLMLSDNSGYYDFLRLTTYWSSFKFTSLVISLPPYYPGQSYQTVEVATTGGGSQDQVITKTMMAHRLEFRLWNRVNLAVNEALMMAGSVAMANYNPLDIFHNWFIWEQAKSLFSAEVTVTPLRGLKVYSQFAMDQIQTGLKDALYNAQSVPNGIAWLLGAKAEYPVAAGYLTTKAQFTNVGPWIYIAGDPTKAAADIPEPWLSYYMRERIVSNVTGNREFLTTPTGWWDGPDSREYDLEFTYRVPAAYSVTLGGSFLQHGTNSITTDYAIGAAEASMTTPGDSPINTLTVHLGGSLATFAPITFGVDGYYVYVWNVGHDPTKSANALLAEVYVSVGF